MSRLRGAAAALVLAAACDLGPGYSMNDPQYFFEPPSIVVRGREYGLHWGFFFRPECAVRKQGLVCALQTTTSSGARTGRSDAIAITDARSIEAIEADRAFWWEPDGSLVKLSIRRDAP